MSTPGYLTAARRALTAQLLRDTCRIRPTIGTTDAYNADAASWPGVSAVVSCLVAEAKADAASASGVIDLASTKPAKLIVFQHGTTVEATWRVEWVEGHTTYAAVEAAKPGSTDLGVECVCVEV